MVLVEPPKKITAYNPEIHSEDTATLVGEHGPYWIYEFVSTGFRILIPKGDVHKFI